MNSACPVSFQYGDGVAVRILFLCPLLYSLRRARTRLDFRVRLRVFEDSRKHPPLSCGDAIRRVGAVPYGPSTLVSATCTVRVVFLTASP
ncbi:hypothetical protein NDU88_005195 [Pleurodeles waltl]|uniref:Secreted protein n=1 Tax=Pleurodeles waltl TaxID=8319 RepID=A0AAV7TTK6_PLEWA|nr:hypothetical protein NDU88_005195 [Pleurodeles waltl]